MNSIVTQRFIESHKCLMEEGVIRSIRQFSNSLEFLPQSMGEILKGRRDVTIELLRKAIKTYHINPDYLFKGSLPMFQGKKLNLDTPNVLTIVTDTDDEERIFHVPIAAQAGYGQHIQNPVFFQELPSFTLPDYRFKSGTHRCFDVSGDSMEPTLFSGDKIVCSYIPKMDWKHSLKNNFVYVVITKNDVLVKRLANQIEDSGDIQLMSDNRFYKPYQLNIDDIFEIWYVRVKISPFMPSPNNIRNGFHDEVEELKNTIKAQTMLIENLNKTIEKLLKQNRVRI